MTLHEFKLKPIFVHLETQAPGHSTVRIPSIPTDTPGLSAYRNWNFVIITPAAT